MAFLAKVTAIGAAFLAAGGVTVGAVNGQGAKPGDPSPFLAAAIKAGLPGYQAPADLPKPAVAFPSPFVAAADKSASTDDLVRMSKVEVRESPIPAAEQVLTFKGQAEVAMERYLGDLDGLDRGLLNRITIADLWKKIPILGQIVSLDGSTSISNESRALALAGQDERIALRNYLKELIELGSSGPDSAVRRALRQVDEVLAP